jgi:hypothetical protein
MPEGTLASAGKPADAYDPARQHAAEVRHTFAQPTTFTRTVVLEQGGTGWERPGSCRCSLAAS